MRILADKSALVVIDVQQRLFPHIHEHDLLEKNLNILSKGMTALEIPTIVTEQYVKGLGSTIPSLQESLGDNYKPIEKMEFSCADCSPFLSELRMTGKENVILCGIESHVCVLQTGLDLKEKGFNVIVVEDCVSSRNQSDKTTAIRRYQHEGFIVTSYESLLFELLRVSGTDVFKQISKLVK
jgi:nicotinamidase-related amidase